MATLMSSLAGLAFRYLLLSVLLCSIELCIVTALYDFQIYSRGDLLNAIASSTLVYFSLLMIFGTIFLCLGTLVRSFSSLKQFSAQAGFIFFLCFVLVFNFYVQQYVFPGQALYAPLPIVTLTGSLGAGVALGLLLKRFLSTTGLEAKTGGAAFALLALAALILTFEIRPGEGRPESSPSRADPRPNILLITIDTLRADHLGCYGDLLVDTPVIDKLAATGTRLVNCITPVPLTLPSHASMLTGRYPPAITTRRNRDVLPASETTLAEILRENGYRTAAVVGAVVLSARGGLIQGFDDYYDRMVAPDAYFLRILSGRVKILMGEYADKPGTDPIW